jgi:two-component system chemotaxis response regulator CheY
MKRVLLIDDAATIRLYHRSILEPLGFEVEEAANGYEALEKILTRPFDLLLVDVNMPMMDGYTLVKTLRQNDQGLNDIPVIIISTESELCDARAAYLVGANLYLNKPLKPPVLSCYARLLSGEAQS